MSQNPKPMLLVILDGWGYSEITEGNAIEHADKPVWDRLWGECPHTLIRGSGAEVGLPADQMGNSEVGHLNLGAGRVVYQEYTRVSRSIKTGSFFANQTLVDAAQLAVDTDKAVHILGLLSPGGVHSHEEHIHAMVELAVKQGAKKVYVHAFLDGRDTAPKSAIASIEKMEARFAEIGGGRFASIIGRYFAMDRDHRWPRIQSAYDLITLGKGEFSAETALQGLEMAYERDESDEFVKATAVVPAGTEPVKVEDGDVVVFMNYRSDRARQITRPFIEPDFDAFERAAMPKLGRFVSLTEYNSEYDIPVAYPPDRLKNVFGEYISGLGMHQLRIAETEKYAHVTFFFNGGREEPFEFEDRVLINSPNVATYDLQPEMSAPELTDKLVDAIEGQEYDVIICNYANPDMVGHSGDFDATVKAIEAIDQCLARVVDSIRKAGGELLITADHGNAEMMQNTETNQAHTAHTTNLVPLIYVGRDFKLEANGALSDIAPTMLELMGIPLPAEMNGRSLIAKPEEAVQQDAV
ncbi:2,3-bisphosphoglycerate-independent phosphoglycerate mutase [Thiohalophilus sp.]|uniref:2,3-bisphosphoglycerate-independent phosphoglycerate mutase n=1 Tax=Thiohalophilus sp. TaxID=3028392 RepID=UPI002ACD2077|nr:2,3-bisphosphoglycerate-independent phosphoglycerate mutase [Thiohalophilus sp.]MDZ7661456.1 2,3-bisphosphoglycerate-independent phosphoglycerate mutase [Thiohalophilus sp.]